MSMKEVVSACGLIVVLLSGSLCGDEPNEPAARDPSQESTRELLSEAVGWYDLFAASDDKQPMRPLVALRWTNQTRGSIDGITVLWIHQGRPEAVACIYPFGDQLYHWFNSMSRGEIEARREGRQVWRPIKPELQFRPTPDAPEPAATPPQRLQQMKLIAGDFSSHMLGWNADDSDREELRMLPTPLYRYTSEDRQLLDGAVFAFVQGTDPESLLMLEAVKSEKGFRWEYAFVRRTSGRLEGRYRDSVVWTAIKSPVETDPLRDPFAISRPIVVSE